MKSESGLIVLGRVVGAHGLQGSLKIATETFGITDPGIFATLAVVEIGNNPYRVKTAARKKRQVLLQLEEITSRSRAESLVGLEVKADRRRFPTLPPGEYYWFEVLGLPVVDARDGTHLGRLAEIIPTPAHDVYVVRQGEQEMLLPAVAEVITEIDPEEGWIKALVPAGLLAVYAD